MPRASAWRKNVSGGGSGCVPTTDAAAGCREDTPASNSLRSRPPSNRDAIRRLFRRAYPARPSSFAGSTGSTQGRAGPNWARPVYDEPLICAECGREPREDENAEDEWRTYVAQVVSLPRSRGTSGITGTTMSDPADTTSFTFRLDAELWRRVKVLAALEGKSASEWLREAAELAVEATEGKAATQRSRVLSTSTYIPPDPRPRPKPSASQSSPSEPPDSTLYSRAGCPRKERRGVRCRMCGEVHRH
jgi:hypothetical protein